MSEVIIFLGVAVVMFLIVRRFISVKRFNSTDEYLDYKQKKEEELRELEEEWDDELIDKKSFNFLFIGAVATILFLIFGLFTGNSFYFVLILFVITAVIYLYFSTPNSKF